MDADEEKLRMEEFFFGKRKPEKPLEIEPKYTIAIDDGVVVSSSPYIIFTKPVVNAAQPGQDADPDDCFQLTI